MFGAKSKQELQIYIVINKSTNTFFEKILFFH